MLKTLKRAWQLVTIVIGFTVLAMGIAMIVLPGPAIAVIPIGLAILSSEFVWARRLLRRTKARITALRNGPATGQSTPRHKGELSRKH